MCEISTGELQVLTSLSPPVRSNWLNARYNWCMASVSEHYERLLSKHYTWMAGASFEEKVKEQNSFLSRTLGPLANNPEATLAVDLGCGPGFQTIALAQLGFSPVIAVDTSSELLAELRSRVGNFPVRIEKADLRDLSTIVPAGQATVIVCMGDTLTHLPGKGAVTGLFRRAFDALRPGGRFIITYRDLTTELCGTDRFIPIRSDEDKIMTCFLEFESAESVMVHDLIYIREGAGWSLSKSSYRKTRLGMDWMCEELGKAGFTAVSQDLSGRLVALAATRR
jgi:SAM-dependent methyltransferase